MQALFIGHTYIDVTLLCSEVPSGDEKTVAQDYAVSFGGNAVTAAFACAKLGIIPDLIATVADDWLGRMFLDMAETYRIPVHPRKVKRSSLSFVLPNDGKRAIIRARDDHYLEDFPRLDLTGCRALHLDGHQADAALHYAKACRDKGILTSLDGGGLRGNIEELLDLHRYRHRRRAALRTNGAVGQGHARLSESEGLSDRWRHDGRARHALV